GVGWRSLMAKGNAGYSPFRIPGDAVLKEPQGQPAYRSESLRAGAKRPLQQAGGAVFPARHGNAHSVLLSLVRVFATSGFDNRTFREELRQARLQDGPEALSVVALTLQLIL